MQPFSCLLQLQSKLCFINKSVNINYNVRMFQQKVLNSNQFPVPDKSRKSTDIICTFLGAAFAITLFVLACVFWNKEKFQNKFFNRFDQKGALCNGNKLLYNDITNTSLTSCVNRCPLGYYENNGVCLPENSDRFNQYLQNNDIVAPLQYSQFKWVLFYSFIISIGLGFVWLLIVNCVPRMAPIIAHVGAILSLIAFGVLTLVLQDYFWSKILWLKILVASICFLLAIIIFVMLCFYANQLKFQGLFLDYAGRFLGKYPTNFVYLLIYGIFMFGLVALTVWQHCCFASKYGQSRDFFNFNNIGVLQILNILQFIWAAQFLRDSYNFCVAGNATDFYWKDQGKSTSFFSSYKRLLCNHWGSVVGGSFLNAFFQIPTLIVELLICHPTTCCSKLGSFCYNSCNWCSCLFDLVRTDAYSYINITGIPFCNAGRQCKKICENAKHFVGSHSPIKHYRFVSHVFLLVAALIGGWFILRARLWSYGFWNLALIIVVIYITITFFIDINSNAAEALQVSYLCEYQLQPNHGLLQRLDPKYTSDLQQLQKHQLSDGNC